MLRQARPKADDRQGTARVDQPANASVNRTLAVDKGLQL